MITFKSYDYDTDEITLKVHCPKCGNNDKITFSDIVQELGREPKEITIVDIMDLLHSKEYHWKDCPTLRDYKYVDGEHYND